MEDITIGYPRVSTPTQSLDRQIQNIKAAYPSAILFPEKFTGTKIDPHVGERALSGDGAVAPVVLRVKDCEVNCTLSTNL